MNDLLRVEDSRSPWTIGYPRTDCNHCSQGRQNYAENVYSKLETNTVLLSDVIGHSQVTEGRDHLR